MERMTHAEYLASVRHNAGRVAASVISGTTNLLDGCLALAPLLAQAELDSDDSDAKAIEFVCSELDGLPLGDFRNRWAPEALDRLAPELESAIAWATPVAMPAIQSLARRFGA
jgi:hypothetical protein